jgi:hypothetical protein
MVRRDCNSALFLLGGFRFAQLDQDLVAQQVAGTPAGLNTVSTNLQFKAMGFRGGVEGERVSPRRGILVYGRGVANLLGGETNAAFTQVNQFGTAPIGMSVKDYRLMWLLEAEFGVGWESHSKRWRLNLGYLINAWTNTLTTGDIVHGVHSGVFEPRGDLLTFDGLVARIEYRR